MGKSFIPRHKKEQQVELLLLYVFERITVFEKYISILENVKPKQFPLASWEYTYRYLCGFEKHFYCIDDVKRAICEWAHEG